MNPRKTLISTDDSRYIDDSRLSVERPKMEDWNLMIREVRHNDSGEYMCQINTKPVKIKRIYLVVLGRFWWSMSRDVRKPVFGVSGSPSRSNTNWAVQS